MTLNYDSELLALWQYSNGLHDTNNKEYNGDDKSFKYVYKFYIANGCVVSMGLVCVWIRFKWKLAKLIFYVFKFFWCFDFKKIND